MKFIFTTHFDAFKHAATWYFLTALHQAPIEKQASVIKPWSEWVVVCIMQYQFVSADPQYLSCGNSQCQKEVLDECLVKTCNGSITFRIINIRTDVVFVFFTGGLDVPCVLETSNALSFANPSSPLYGHLSSLDSTGTSVCTNSNSCLMIFIIAIFLFVCHIISACNMDCSMDSLHDLSSWSMPDQWAKTSFVTCDYLRWSADETDVGEW